MWIPRNINTSYIFVHVIMVRNTEKQALWKDTSVMYKKEQYRSE